MGYAYGQNALPTNDIDARAATGREPRVTVGIVLGDKISFVLNGPYLVGDSEVEGPQEAVCADGAVVWRDERHDSLLFRPVEPTASFALNDVTIGINFHWERRETQVFSGALRLIVEAGKVRAINELPVEDYLSSVISSEMSATSSLELLKAHAVISRSWLLAQMAHRATPAQAAAPAFVETDEELTRWYDREDHTLFDVCADDHCQRYQGITKATSPHVAEAIAATRGQLLMADGEICDARFSKCCGGVMEEFQYCWDNTPKPYLRALADTATPAVFPDLTDEREAERWIRTAPPSYCNTHDKKVLAQVLNNFDQETTDFYRWHVVYTQRQLQDLVARKLGIDFGRIIDLVPMGRGRSGRLYRLKIVGTRTTLIIGKELEIRRALSESHLYSSAFVVDRREVGADGVPAAFELTGAGWGHGVGLCQIGAAMMGEQGFGYEQILLHYYPGATIERAYK